MGSRIQFERYLRYRAMIPRVANNSSDIFAALKSYENRVEKYTQQLLQEIDKRQSTPINVTDWFNFYSFDVMADLAFGRSFNMLLTGQAHFVLDILRQGQKMIGVLSYQPWLFNLLSKIPGAAKDFNNMDDWCKQQVERRRKVVKSL